MIEYYTTYRYNITWGDQDLINIFFHYRPGNVDTEVAVTLLSLIRIFDIFSTGSEMLYVYPCEWNYRADHCMYGSVCKSAEKTGALVLHGNRAYFHNEKQPPLKAVYQAIRDVRSGVCSVFRPVLNYAFMAFSAI